MGLKAVASGIASITGGTITGVSGVPYTLAKGGIPLIGLSSGSVAANGVISAITALPLAYPSAYCWFPANALATSIAAGWYYCTFSTTTAGVAFLNTYTSGVPTIPASPTAVTDGKGAFTGDTGEEFGNTITVPANALGVTGNLRISFCCSQTSNANGKTSRVRYSGNGGTVVYTQSLASQGFIPAVMEISNTGATNAQISKDLALAFNTPGTMSALSTVDTTASTTVVISIQRVTATDNIVILPPTVELMS